MNQWHTIIEERQHPHLDNFTKYRWNCAECGKYGPWTGLHSKASRGQWRHEQIKHIAKWELKL